jgi:hypothetical protein
VAQRAGFDLAEQVASWPSWATGAVLLGNGTGQPTVVAPGNSGHVLTDNGSAWVSAAPSGGSAPFSDASALVKNSSDATKLGEFSAAGISSGNTRVYNLPDGSGALNAEQFITQTSTHTLTSQTAAQKLFNSTTNGAVTLAAGTYFFECLFTLSSLGLTTNFGFALGGTATIAGQLWQATASQGPVSSTGTANLSTSFNTAANTALLTTASSTNVNGFAIIKGKLRISAAGTLIPEVSLATAAAAIVAVDSYFRIWPVGSSTVTNVGAWS